MLKVFIAEDESVVREGLKKSIPWNDCGFEFAGDAMDGETALPMILDIKPDLLITDIKMPFMDGLELCRRVKEALPSVYIIILSGYDDFEFARQAIELRVSQYLLKPILKAKVVDALNEARQRIEEEQEQRNFIRRFADEAQEYEQFSRRKFFEQLLVGKLPEAEAYARAEELGIPLSAEFRSIVMYMIQPRGAAPGYSESVAELQETVVRDILDRDYFTLFRSSPLSYSVMIRGNAENIAARTAECLEIIRSACVPGGDGITWYAAPGRPAERLGDLAKSYSEAARLFANRHLTPEVHILLEGAAGRNKAEDFAPESYNADPMVVRNFVKTGLREELTGFIESFLAGIGSAGESAVFKNYLVVSLRLNSAIALQELEVSRKEIDAALPALPKDIGQLELSRYFAKVLKAALNARDAATRKQSADVVNIAIEYVDSHFAEESISLNSVAMAINVSASYLSAAFSQKKGISLVEYITQRKINRAKELLRQTSMHSGAVGAEVGYKNPQYFSFVFRKTVGCTPKEYRAGKAAK